MDLEKFRDYCLSLPGTTEGLPFGEDVLVFKVMNKMFALTDINHFESINLKCDPDRAIELRDLYPSVLPGYHMNKKHWNTILMDNGVPDAEILAWTLDSYNLVANTLPKKLKDELEGLKKSLDL